MLTDGERLRTALVNILANARDAVAARGTAAGGAPDIDITTAALRTIGVRASSSATEAQE